MNRIINIQGVVILAFVAAIAVTATVGEVRHGNLQKRFDAMDTRRSQLQTDNDGLRTAIYKSQTDVQNVKSKLVTTEATSGDKIYTLFGVKAAVMNLEELHTSLVMAVAPKVARK